MAQNISHLYTKSRDIEYNHENGNRDLFAVDRDKILFSTEFRRLDGKTQVFVSGFDDHMRNRLTHTLEVSQIAVSICKDLGLNATLAEAIALGHDIGHTPFGHVGERFLNLLTNNCFKKVADKYQVEKTDTGFKHNLQGVKVATKLEKIYPDKEGLGLTSYTLWGIANHSSLTYKKCIDKNADGRCSLFKQDCKLNDTFNLDHYTSILSEAYSENDWSIEAIIVREADEIAQRHHDLEDGIRAKLIDPSKLVAEFPNMVKDYILPERAKYFLYQSLKHIDNSNIFHHNISSFLISLYSDEIKKQFKKFEELNKNTARKDVDYTRFLKSPYSENFSSYNEKLSDILKSNILFSQVANQMDGKANYKYRN